MDYAITIYGKPDCTRCTALVRRCRRKGVRYRYRDVTQDPEARAEVEALGYTSLPVGVIGDDHFCGVNYDKIDALAAQASLSKAS